MKRLWALLLLALLPVEHLVFRNQVLLQHEVFISDGLHNLLPQRAFLGRSLREGRFPLWNPDEYSGVPFLAQIDGGPLYLPSWFFWSIWEPYTAWNLSIGFSTLVAALGMALLCRRGGAHVLGAILGGLAFASAGVLMAHLKHITIHTAAIWLPWGVLATEAFMAQPNGRRLVLLALVSAAPLFAGQPQVTYLCLLLMGLRALHLSFGGGLALGAKRLAAALAGVVLGIGLTATSLIPTVQFLQNTGRAVGLTFEDAAWAPFVPRDLLTLLVAGINGNHYNGTYNLPGVQWEDYLYMGIAPVFLALLGLKRHKGFWVFVVVAALVMMLSPHTPLFRVFYEVIPGLKLFRFPHRFSLWLTCGLAYLASMGLTVLWEQLKADRGSRWATGVALLVLLFHVMDVTVSHRPFLPAAPHEAWTSRTEVAGFIQDHGGGRVITVDSHGMFRKSWFEERGFNEGVGGWLKHAAVPLGGSGILLGLQSPDGNTNMVSEVTASYWGLHHTDWIQEDHKPPFYDPTDEHKLHPRYLRQLQRAATRWVIADRGLNNAEAVLQHEDYWLHQVVDPHPRALLATGWQQVGDGDAMAAHVQGGNVLPAVWDRESSPGNIMPLLVRDVSDCEVEVVLEGHPGGLLVLADTWTEEWRAWVDGEPSEVSLVNGWMRGVWVPAGAKGVVFRYRPAGYGLGRMVSAGCIVILVGISFGWVSKHS